MKREKLAVFVSLLLGLTILGAPVFAQEGEETSANNLSYPARFYVNALQTGLIGSHSLLGEYPIAMSYGCLIPETIGTTTYPNTSCVDISSGAPQTKEACQARCDGLAPDAAPVKVEPIYWQKQAANKWQANYETITTPLPVEYVDWGDNLESKSWPVQVIRVETNTFSTLNNPGGPRIEMWHVFGQGTTELWGAHADYTPHPYVYLDSTGTSPTWPFGINVSAGARINLAKLGPGTGSCPTTYIMSPYAGVTTFIPATSTLPAHWQGATFTYDQVYGAELNIKGSYVYGYNWNLRSMNTQGVVKTGWWRLTFYTPDNSIDFGGWTEPTATDNTFAPPPDQEVEESTTSTTATEEGESGPLYVPVVDKTNNLTFIDVCITTEKGGGKKGPK